MTENMTDSSAVVDDAAGPTKTSSSMENLPATGKGHSDSASIESPATLDNERLSTIVEASSIGDLNSDGSVKGHPVQIEAKSVDSEADQSISPTVTIDASAAADNKIDAGNTSEPTDTIDPVGKTDEDAGPGFRTALKVSPSEDDVSCTSSRPASRRCQDSETDDASIGEESATTTHSHPREDSETFRVISYHIDADLYVKVRVSGEPVMYKVHSTLIAAASPVWREMIYKGKCPRPATGRWVTEMVAPEDDAFGLDVIFSLIHYKFHELPGSLNVDEMYGLARVAEKYDCKHILIPYMSKWLVDLEWHLKLQLEENIKNEGDKKTDEDDKTLFLTWVFGLGRWFAKVVSRVAYKATINDDGTLLDASCQPWKAQGLPSGILDVIADARLKALKKVIASVSVPYEQLLAGDDGVKFCRAKEAPSHTKELCQEVQFGSLARNLRAARLIPFPDAESYKGSVQDLAAKFEAIKVSHYKLPDAKPHQDSHGSCGIQHRQAIRDALSGVVPLTGFFVQELKDRAKRSGAYNEQLFNELKDMEERNPSPIPEDDLREDGTHYKQQEDFASAPDYYSESYYAGAKVIIKVEDVDV
ncbi:hypothetical protein QBC34DRAFT_350776 [Podospora aff. communis PSN243]|uniref:BTB domain-containing protein n=1 Tax=Podospora aff. communis PSN243 TaxID=3040156 RepID=A0AAV9GSJ8_9PEZI|nr:hypothetical protein QBC34DRAFT_350776 [Podospora aff. communis PSN243]